MMSQIGMEHERRNDYDRNIGNQGWVQIDGYNQETQQSPMLNGYDGFQYIQPSHGLPSMDSSYSRMPPPPPTTTTTTSTTTHSTQPQLLPLLMPSHHPTWPSMLTNPAGSYQAPLPIPPAPAPLKTIKLPSLQTSTPRKTLTDDDRRRMCQYHESHPNTKQIEIGGE